MAPRHADSPAAGRRDRAVSPVIGVILMVAITVILASVIGVFVIGIGSEETKTAPTVTLNAEDGDDNFNSSAPGETYDFARVAHKGGDRVGVEELEIVVRNEENVVVGRWRAGEWSDNATGVGWSLVLNGQADQFDSGTYASTEIGPGDRLVLEATVYSDPHSAVPDDATYTIEWLDHESEKLISEQRVSVR